MQLFHSLKAKYRRKPEKKYAKIIKRQQLNFNCSEGIIDALQFIAVILEVPRYVLAEHLLQLGSYHVAKANRDPKKRERQVEHLVQVHLLGDELTDDEDILRLGEDN